MATYRYENPNAKERTRWDEIRQRAFNARTMIWFAWVALRLDSATFALMITNSVRDMGDGLVSAVMQDGRRID